MKIVNRGRLPLDNFFPYPIHCHVCHSDLELTDIKDIQKTTARSYDIHNEEYEHDIFCSTCPVCDTVLRYDLPREYRDHIIRLIK